MADGQGRTLSTNTIKGYGYDWRYFEHWCRQQALPALPAEARTVALYLAAVLLNGKKVTTAERFASGIAYKHRHSHLESPVTDDTRKLLRNARRYLAQSTRRSRPLTVEHLRTIDKTLAGMRTKQAWRDRALVWLGFASALRGASITLLTMDDVTIDRKGVSLNIRREKQDRLGKGRVVGIPRGKKVCPVVALEDWIKRRGRKPGPLFHRLDPRAEGAILPLCPKGVPLIVRRAMRLAGFNTAGFAAHSMRAGFVTATAEAGAGELLIASQTGHRSMENLREYFRRYDLFRANAFRFLKL